MNYYIIICFDLMNEYIMLTDLETCLISLVLIKIMEIFRYIIWGIISFVGIVFMVIWKELDFSWKYSLSQNWKIDKKYYFSNLSF